MTRHTEDRQTGQRGVVRALAAVGALGALAVLVLVVPYVLVALTQALPLDLGALSPASWGRADDGRLLLLAIVGVAWAAWVVMVLSVGLETWAAVRRVPTPTLPGMAVPQRTAAVLVASILVALSPGPAAPAVGEPVGSGASGGASEVALSVAPPGLWRGPGAATSGAGDQVGAVRAEAARVGTDLVGADRVEAVRVGTDRVDIEDLRERSRVSRSGLPLLEQSAGGPAAPTVTTERHDTLWLLAEQYLGAGVRFVEIVELNRGEVQPDGRSLGDDGRLYPGWTLALPADAAVGAVRPDRHRVVRGDTLWQIAEDELGDPRRYPELAEANRGDLQPDGRSLAEPDLILPGWILEIPGRVDAASRPAPDQSPEAAEREAAAEARAAAGLRAAADLEAGADAPEADAPVASGSAGDGTDEDAQGAPDAAIPLPGPIAMAPIDRAATDPSASTAPPAQTLRRTAPPAQTAPPPAPTDGAGGPLPLNRGSLAPTTSEEEPDGGALPDATIARTLADPDSGAGDTDGAAQGVDEPELDPDSAATAGAMAIALPAGGAVATLLLAGVGAELMRRRRQFQRHRRPGERMPASGPGAQQVERAARAAGREPGLDLLGRALVQLADEAEGGGQALPDVRSVRVGEQSVVLDLAVPSGPAIAPFVAADDTRWALSPELLVDELPDRPPALTGLVTLGFAGAEAVLLNLESVGTLAVTGPREATGAVLRGLAADLAFGPSCALTERLLCLADPAVAEAVEAGGIGVERDPARATSALTAAMAPPATSGPASAGTASDEGDPLLIVLSDHSLDVRVPARCGCALITSAPVAGAGATLVVDGSGMAVLLPEREHLAPQHLSRTATRDIVEALGATDLPEADPGQAGLWEAPPSASGVIDLRESASMSGAVGDPRWREEQRLLPLGLDPGGPASEGAAAAVPRVLVLGEVLVENAHGRCESTRIGRLAETAAFVLLNPGSRPSELQGALWPGRRSNPQTCRQMISRARTWLGRTDAGEPYLMTFAESEGRLRLRAEVGSDWADFQRLADLGLADPEDTEHLTAALALVRGRPFGAVASRELPWADLHINEMISLIGDVAHALAVRHERAGRRSAARDAALRGLRTESESEVLEAIVARTAV